MIAAIKHEVLEQFNGKLVGVSAQVQSIKEAGKAHADELRIQQDTVLPQTRAKIDEVIDTLKDGLNAVKTEAKESIGR